jgi:saccharopine dehydrogenase-like NADP-dependent oxidoreductase
MSYKVPEWSIEECEQLTGHLPVQILLRHLHQMQLSLTSQRESLPFVSNWNKDENLKTIQNVVLESSNTQSVEELSLTEESPLCDYHKLQQHATVSLHRLSQYHHSSKQNDPFVSTDQISHKTKGISSLTTTKKTVITTEALENLSWMDFFAPATINECCDNTRVINLLFLWLQRWKQQNKNEPKKNTQYNTNDEVRFSSNSDFNRRLNSI